MSAPPLPALDLAALLCSRVCHDLISPVGAIVNGLEVLEEEKDEGTKQFALDLIINSTHVLLVATRDLIDCHAVEAVSIGRPVVTNQAGLACTGILVMHALRLLVGVCDVIEVRGARECDLVGEMGIDGGKSEAWSMASDRCWRR